MPVPNIDRSLQAGILADLKESWRQSIPVFRKQQEKLFKFLPQTNIRTATWVWKESLPFPAYWPYGKGRTKQNFKDRFIQLGKYNYELSIPWSRFDEEDDQLGDLRTHVQSAVKRYGMLPDVLASEYFNGAASLNPSILNAYDGVSLFSTVDGDGAARLGVTGGNIVTGSGLTLQGTVHDFFVAMQRFLDMTDPTTGKPIFSPDDVQLKNMFCLVPNEALEVFKKAAESEYFRVEAANITSEYNIVKGTFEWEPNPYLTDPSDWYIILTHPYYKPFLYREPGNVETIIADMNNSDSARETGEYAIFTHVRTAIGPWFPYVILKINN